MNIDFNACAHYFILLYCNIQVNPYHTVTYLYTYNTCIIIIMYVCMRACVMTSSVSNHAFLMNVVSLRVMRINLIIIIKRSKYGHSALYLKLC